MDASSISHCTIFTKCHVSKHELKKKQTEMELEEAASWLMCFRLNCFDIKSLSLKIPDTLSSTNVLLGFKWEQKHIFGSYFSFKSFLVNQDQKKKKKKERKLTQNAQKRNKTWKNNSPKIYKLRMCRPSLMAFFPPHCKHWCCRRLQLFLTNTFVGPASRQYAWIWTRLQEKQKQHVWQPCLQCLKGLLYILILWQVSRYPVL